MKIDRRSMMKAGAAAVAVSTPAAVVAGVTATVPAVPADPILALVQRLEAADREYDRLQDAADAVSAGLPEYRPWTPAEMAEHRIQGGTDAARYITPPDLDKADSADRPRDSRFTVKETIDQTAEGRLATTVITVLTFDPPAEEMKAWRDRCAARRALFDDKTAEQRKVEHSSGYTAVQGAADRALAEWQAIFHQTIITPATTVAGALAKMRIFRRESVDSAVRSEEMDSTKKLFLSALADLERVGGEV